VLLQVTNKTEKMW